MSNRSDIVFHLNGENLIPMPSRLMREGLLGKTLEDALQTFFEKYPQIIPGKQIIPTIAVGRMTFLIKGRRKYAKPTKRIVP